MRKHSRRIGEKVILSSKKDAENVREALINLLDTYEVVSIVDLYDLVGLPTVYVDNKWGWTTLENVEITQIPEGYILDLPSAKPI